MSLPFNNNIDKITERELVPDIVERLKISSDLKSTDNSTVFISKTPLKKILSAIVSAFPFSITNILGNSVLCYNIQIDEGTSIIQIPQDEKPLIKVYLENSFQDITDLTEYDSSTGGYRIVLDTPLSQTGYIKCFFAAKNKVTF